MNVHFVAVVGKAPAYAGGTAVVVMTCPFTRGDPRVHGRDYAPVMLAQVALGRLPRTQERQFDDLKPAVLAGTTPACAGGTGHSS